MISVNSGWVSGPAGHSWDWALRGLDGGKAWLSSVTGPRSCDNAIPEASPGEWTETALLLGRQQAPKPALCMLSLFNNNQIHLEVTCPAGAFRNMHHRNREGQTHHLNAGRHISLLLSVSHHLICQPSAGGGSALRHLDRFSP